MIKKSLIVSMVGIVLFGCVFSQSLDGFEENYVPGEVVVKYKDTRSSGLRKDSLSVGSLSLESDFDNLEIKEQLDNSENIVLMGITDDQSVEDVIESLQGNGNIEYAEPNYIRYLFYMEDFSSSDPGKLHQWGLDSISWADGYNSYSGRLQSSVVKVGVIDNGVNYNHSDLKDSMWSGDCMLNGEVVACQHGYDFFHDTPTPLPNEDTHGTHVAGIIAAGVNNGKGIIGVNPYAKVVALKVGRARQFTTADEVKAINFAIDNGIKIINASYGSKASSDIEKDAIRRFGEVGGLFVTAAGNDRLKDLDNGFSLYPCKYDLDNILCVAAIDENGGLASYSNYGAKSVDVAAPGSNIYSTIVKGNVMKNIFSGKFEGCTSGGTIQGWNSGLCFKWKSDYGWGYQFTGEITSPSMNLSGRNDVYISLSLACDSKIGVDVDIEYSTGDGNYVSNEHFGLVGQKGAKYTFNVGSNYYVENFSFKLKAFDDTELFDDICVIDDVEVYEDPYVVNDNDRYGEVSGTSMATPHVAGLASLVRAINPKLSYQQVKEYIMNYGDDNTYCAGKTVSGKTINVRKTLDAVVENIVSKPESLMSSRTGFIKWDPSVDAVEYYYEVLSGENIVQSGFTEFMGVETNLSGSYKWKVQAIDEFGNKSKFVESFICKKPELTDVVLSGFECSKLELNLGIDDNCVDMYNFVWDNSEVGLEFMENSVSSLSSKLYIENGFGERTNEVLVSYSLENSLPTMDIAIYNYPTIITSAGEVTIGDVISLFGVKDGACGSGSIAVNSVSCNEANTNLDGNVLKVNVPSSKEGSAQCLVEFQDDEGFVTTGVFNYSFNTLTKPTGSAGGGGGPGGSNGGGSNGGGAGSVKEETQHGAASNTGNAEDSNKSELQKPDMIELFEEENKKSDFDFSWYNNSNPNFVLSNGYSVEFNNAYTFARKAGITTTNSIQDANMGGKLTRIAMAKMLSNYAINVLGKRPANKLVPMFPDVSAQLNEDYGGAVDLAYQLGIMGVGIDNFRPNDVVTRGEFATALSRMLYGTSDGTPYYSTHISKLLKEGIITNSDPKINELRGYVMIMLMRSAKNG